MKLEKLIEQEKIFLWTDSEIVLAWIKNPLERDRFVTNRLTEIRSFENLWIGHVSSEQNPADLLSRGITPSLLNYYHHYYLITFWL
jgi:hypothetical protein